MAAPGAPAQLQDLGGTFGRLQREIARQSASVDNIGANRLGRVRAAGVL